MTRRISRRSQDELLIHKWWPNLILAIVLLVATYGIASLAINSGSLLEYVLSFLLLGWAINRLIRGVRYIFDR